MVDEVTVTAQKPQAPVGVPFADVTVSVARRRDPVPVVIALGANLGDAQGALMSAVASIMDLAGVAAVQVSDVVETDPVGGPDQPVYLNQVVTATTWWSAPRLLASLHRIEAEHGRVREIRWGARTLDLDLIQYGTPGMESEWRSESEDLMLPHPRAHERGFVLVPWLDVDPDARLRVGEQVVAVADRLDAVETSGVRPLAEERTDCGCGAGGCGS